MHDSVSVPKQKGPFYGWWIVLLAFVNNLMGVGIGTYAIAVFIKPMTEDEELNWTRTEIVWAVTISIIVATVTAPLAGLLLDKKHGARLLTVFMGITGAIGISLVGVIHELWQFYLVFGVLSSLFNHYPPFLTSATSVSKWFIRRRGMALALASAGISAGGLIFIPVTQALVSFVGWRSSWIILGIAVAIVVVPAHALFMRGRPEEMGLRPYGVKSPPRRSADPPHPRVIPELEPTWTLGSAMKTHPFWLLLVANNLALAGLIGTLVNQVAYLEDELESVSLAVSVVWVFTLLGFLSRLPWAILADRANPKYSTSAALVFCALGMLLLIKVNSTLAFLYAVCFGFGIGGFDPLISLVWANYYGRTFLGTIRGFITATNVVSFAGAPLFASFMFDTTGDYRNAFVIFLGGFFLGAALVLFAKEPRAPEHLPTLATSS